MTESVHVYLEEKYADQGASKKHQVTALTGVYMASSQVIPFRMMASRRQRPAVQDG